MGPESGLGKSLVIVGVVAVVAGLVIMNRDKLPFLKYFGNLPGDISYKSESTQFYFPIVTCIVISIVVSVILSFFRSR